MLCLSARTLISLLDDGKKTALDYCGYFTDEVVLERLEHELAAERDRQRAEDRKADADRLERIETNIRAMRDLMFGGSCRSRTN